MYTSINLILVLAVNHTQVFVLIKASSVLPVHVAGLVVQSQEGHRRVNGLPALGTEPHHLQARLVDLLRQLVDRNVAGSTHQHWPAGTKVTTRS